ncbi:Uncharacterised protein [Mycobacteroides abscessus subsp. abscessus]|nr:Uncharacterised protein [Mycobacteroides abscessus subsp. abscessus]
MTSQTSVLPVLLTGIKVAPGPPVRLLCQSCVGFSGVIDI